jgi:type VI secretion system secreted protein Hcp
MAFDAFVIFKNGTGDQAAYTISGESQDPTYGTKGAFEISEFSFGAENTLSIGSSTSGAGAGKCTFKEFTVKKLVDKGSPYLLMTLGSGGHYDKVYLYIRKSGAEKGKTGGAYLVFCFGMVAVKSIEWAGSTGDDTPTETVIFEYGALLVGYFQQKKGGGFETTQQVGGWSRVENCELPGGSQIALAKTDVASTPP